VNLFEFEGKRPTVHPEAFVAATATLIGDVTVEKGASIWFGSVVRADFSAIVIREGSNVQDNSILHSDGALEVGAHSTIAHGCIVHCTSIGRQTVVGNGSILLNEAVIGAGTVIAAGSVVTPGSVIPDGVLALGSPARVRSQIVAGSTAERLVQRNADAYVELAQRHIAASVLLD